VNDTVLTEKVWWYLSRSSGLVAWLILALAVIWGLLLSTRLLQERRRPAWLLDLHRWLGGLSVTFTAVHLVGLVLDEYVEIGWRELFLPFASEWRPGAVAWGIVGFYLLVAVQVTSLMMKKLPRRVWRAVHFTSFILFWVASIHAAQAGTDTTTTWYRVGSALMIVAVLFTVAYRALTAGASRRRGKGGDRTQRRDEQTVSSS
jgi:predicted ferric reductase